MKDLLPLQLDEILAGIVLILGYWLGSYEVFFSHIATIALLYLFVCIVFRKYEYVQRKLKK